jgi:dynein heavy chain
MNAELDSLSSSLYNNFLPEKWAAQAPQTEKSLGDWMQYMLLRDEQYKKWVSKGEPKVMWLSGLHYPGAYITALIQ